MIIQLRAAVVSDRADRAVLVGLVAEQAGLVAEQEEAELEARYGGADAGPYPVDPSARVLLAVVDGVAVGCAAIQALDDLTVELKRMYVRSDFRGRGVARRLLCALEALAARLGHVQVRLETGPRQPEAIGLYESAGYRPIPSYGEYVSNPLSLCFEKSLGAMVAPAR